MITYFAPFTVRTGNICCWALYFFVYSIFGSRFQPVKPNPSPADLELWPMIGSPESTPRWGSGSRERLGFRCGTIFGV